MVYKGHIENGKVVFDEPAPLAEGTPVHIEVVLSSAEENEGTAPSLAERLVSVLGKAKDLPADWSENHDSYLREEHRK